MDAEIAEPYTRMVDGVSVDVIMNRITGNGLVKFGIARFTMRHGRRVMNKPITLCDRCEEYAFCLLTFDGKSCRESRTVEPTNADRIRAMTDEELAAWLEDRTMLPINGLWLDWLKQEVKT